YSDEDGTEAEGFAGKIHPDEIAERVARISALADELVNQRAEDRIGTAVEVLVEQTSPDGEVLGRAAHQGPEVDGTVTLLDAADVPVGRFVPAVVVDSDGADLVATASGT